MTATTTRPTGSTPAGPPPAPTVSGRPVVAQLIPCPTCGSQVASLLDGCDRPACRRDDLNDDRAMERLLDL